jgi:hypothetical protein
MGTPPTNYFHMTRVLDAVLDRWLYSPQLSLMQLLKAVAGEKGCCDDNTLVEALRDPAPTLPEDEGKRRRTA